MKKQNDLKIAFSFGLILLLNVNNCFAQLQNSSFENWTNKGTYDNPNNWGNYNELAISGGASAMNIKSTDAHSGTYSCKILTINVPGEGNVGGGLSTGSFDLSSGDLNSKVPFSGGYHDSLIFWLKTNLLNNDSMILLATFYKADVSNPGEYDIVAFGGYNSFGTNTNGWKRIAIYMDSSLTGFSKATPDYVSVLVSTAQEQATTGSYILIDDIQFIKNSGGGGSTGLNNLNNKNNLRIYPNPVKDILNIETLTEINSIRVFNTIGKEFEVNETNKNILNVSNLENGVYLIESIDIFGNSTILKFIKE